MNCSDIQFITLPFFRETQGLGSGQRIIKFTPDRECEVCKLELVSMVYPKDSVMPSGSQIGRFSVGYDVGALSAFNGPAEMKNIFGITTNFVDFTGRPANNVIPDRFVADFRGLTAPPKLATTKSLAVYSDLPLNTEDYLCDVYLSVWYQYVFN